MDLFLDIPLNKQIGFGQLGNSCYMASFLQLFYRFNINYNELIDSDTIYNIKLNLEIIGDINVIDTYNENIIFIRKLNEYIKQLINPSASVSSTKIVWKNIATYLKTSILYLEPNDVSQQDSSMVLLQLLQKLLYPNIQIGYIDEKIINYYNNFFYKLYEIHPYVPRNYVDNFIIIGDNIHKMYYSKNFVGRNIQFNLVSKIQCDKCKSYVINRLKEYLHLEINQYTINLLTNNCMYEKIKQKCEYCFKEEEAKYKSEININWKNPIEINEYQTRIFNETYNKFINNFGEIISDAKYRNINFYKTNKKKVYLIFDTYHIYDIYNIKLYIEETLIGTRKLFNYNKSDNLILDYANKNLVILKVTKEYKPYYLRIFNRYVKDYITESGRFQSLLSIHTEKTYFLTIPNILLLFSVRDFKEGNLTGIFNTPKLSKNIDIILPIFDDNLNIKRYTKVQYALKMLNVGPSQKTINESSIINYKDELSNIIIELLKTTGKSLLECRQELINIIFENTKQNQIGFDKNIFKNKIIEIFENLENLEHLFIDEEQKFNKFIELLQNNIIVPFNVLEYELNGGHYKSVIRNEINNDENKEYKWTEFNDDILDKNIDLNYKSAFYDNARIYVYSRI